MSEWREQSSSSASLSSGDTAVKDVTLTRMLVSTSCMFVTRITPLFSFHTILPFVPELTLNGKYHDTYFLITTVLQMCVYTNSSVNFFVYYFFGTKFRLTVRAMLFGRRTVQYRAGMTTGIAVSTDTAVSSVSQ